MGDIICYPSEATAARAAVDTMNKVFLAAQAPAYFKPYVDNINADWAEWDSSIVFYNNCDAKAIGQRAEALTTEIAKQSNGKVAPPAGNPALQPGAGSNLADLVGKLAVPIVLVAGAIVVAPLLRNASGARK